MSAAKTIKVTLSDNGAYWIRFNRPQKYNAFNFTMYDEVMAALKDADSNPKCKVIVLTGTGLYYTSGTDQSNIMDPQASERGDVFRNLIDLLIDLKKPLIALVNGHVVGMGTSTLGLCDVVVASDKATFICPFTRLALTAEGCSSYNFPRIMGNSMANEMLLFNKKATANEMRQAGLVSRVIPDDKFTEQTEAFVNECCLLNGEVLIKNKALLRNQELKDKLHHVNHHECDVLGEALVSPEALDVVMKFLSKSNKSKL